MASRPPAGRDTAAWTSPKRSSACGSRWIRSAVTDWIRSVRYRGFPSRKRSPQQARDSSESPRPERFLVTTSGSSSGCGMDGGANGVPSSGNGLPLRCEGPEAFFPDFFPPWMDAPGLRVISLGTLLAVLAGGASLSTRRITFARAQVELVRARRRPSLSRLCTRSLPSHILLGGRLGQLGLPERGAIARRRSRHRADPRASATRSPAGLHTGFRSARIHASRAAGPHGLELSAGASATHGAGGTNRGVGKSTFSREPVRWSRMPRASLFPRPGTLPAACVRVRGLRSTRLLSDVCLPDAAAHERRPRDRLGAGGGSRRLQMPCPRDRGEGVARRSCGRERDSRQAHERTRSRAAAIRAPSPAEDVALLHGRRASGRSLPARLQRGPVRQPLDDRLQFDPEGGNELDEFFRASAAL